jgi:(1->4)-alpha-D-glucan 1-alpha-D-glucosylmutase
MKSRTSRGPSVSRRREEGASGVLPGARGTGAAEAHARQNTEGTLIRIPGSTYRLQFSREFTLRDATALLDYLQSFGVTDVYASPLFTAGPESSHGYDVCCHDRVSENLGGADAFERFTDELRRRGIGLLLDIVPNHMAANEGNAWWWDVLKHGTNSRYAKFFDIDWARGEGKIVLPVLEDDIERVIASERLRIGKNDSETVLHYHDRSFPMRSDTPTAAPLGDLLEFQHYRLVCWRKAAEEINYRRFFDVNELVALRVEDAGVFEETHRFILELVRRGKAQGVRVDHPDGLRDPLQYFERLQSRTGGSAGQFYVVAEKILSHDEELRRDWPIAGTTGYDFLNDVNGLFVAAANEPAMTQIYQEFTANAQSFDEVAHRCKKLVLEKSFAGELDALVERLACLTKSAPEALRLALIEIIASFSVYRTYVRSDTVELSDADAEVLRRSFALARTRTVAAAAFDSLEEVLLLRGENVRGRRNELIEFLLRFQQLTGPAAAKGIEDTAFYRFNRLLSLNEVGGEPAQFGITIEEFHRRNLTRAANWPHALLATATHDTKRGEDARARINVLSEMPNEWRSSVTQWRELNVRHKSGANGELAPDANDEYFFYQALAGAWPHRPLAGTSPSEAFRARIIQYMLKALREAKRHTTWTDPNRIYEEATQRFVERALNDPEFLADFDSFHRKVAFFGLFNSLAQTLLKLTAPGVPDIYQGSELFDFNLVDPDNRRPVDFSVRRELLKQVRNAAPNELLNAPASGAAKLFVIQRTLEFRNRHRELFDSGTYIPLCASGEHAENICAFARSDSTGEAVVVCPRLVCTLTNGLLRAPMGNETWGDDALDLSPISSRFFRNVLTEESLADRDSGTLRLAEILQSFPVALLASD